MPRFTVSIEMEVEANDHDAASAVAHRVLAAGNDVEGYISATIEDTAGEDD